ncbi:MAG: TetR-like C-terminal domain-containing protein [Oscillospiraceae bacterium]
MKEKSCAFKARKDNLSLNELVFVTPDYLSPYLKYVKEHKRLFLTMIQNSDVLKLDETYNKMFRNIFNPVMERFHFSPQEREYIATFYLHGLIAIVTKWLENDCKASIEQIIGIMEKCVFPKGSSRID